MIELFTDGACRGNPGPGGWGVLMRANGEESDLSGSAAETTNNRMELTAAIEGLAAQRIRNMFVKASPNGSIIGREMVGGPATSSQ